jgi:hypothetical protein
LDPDVRQPVAREAMDSPDPTSSTLSLDIERRVFVASCAGLVGALTGCRHLLQDTRLAELAINDPHPHEYRPALRALMGVILPFDHPRFPPVSLDEVEARFWEMFPLEDQEQYFSMQRALLVFDAVGLFPIMQPPIETGERRLLDARSGLSADQAVDHLVELRRRDALAFEERFGRSISSGARFVQFPAAPREAYVDLWQRSAFVTRRRFYRAAKSLIAMSAFSMDQFWGAIAYRGPVLPARE